MVSSAPYDALAGEYYADDHLTSRNFDTTTKEALRALSALDHIPSEGLILEAGCGRGRSEEFLGVKPERRVVQLDHSAAMLSLPEREAALLRVMHNAEEMPFPDKEFIAVTAFLCDPFLGLDFLNESRRVLKDGGVFIGTTPSYLWGRALREALGIDVMETRFQLHGGGELMAPSALYPPDQLREMLLRVGFATQAVATHKLPIGTTSVSPDIVRSAEIQSVDTFNLEIMCTMIAYR